MIEHGAGPTARYRVTGVPGTTAATCGGGMSRRGLAIFVAALGILTAPLALSAVDLVAVTESGYTYVLARVDKRITELEITCKSTGLTIGDPVVDIQGLSELDNLQDLMFYQVPQIASYSFLGDCGSLKRLVISFGRVRSIDFLLSLPNLIVFHLEFCDDWESDQGLPFIVDPVDLSQNTSLEYLAFRVCDLKKLPLFLNVPQSLMLLDFSYNPLVVDEENSAALEPLINVRRIYLAGARVAPSLLVQYGNLILEADETALSEYLER
jgi:hypothetical protein